MFQLHKYFTVLVTGILPQVWAAQDLPYRSTWTGRWGITYALQELDHWVSDMVVQGTNTTAMTVETGLFVITVDWNSATLGRTLSAMPE